MSSIINGSKYWSVVKKDGYYQLAYKGEVLPQQQTFNLTNDVDNKGVAFIKVCLTVTVDLKNIE